MADIDKQRPAGDRLAKVIARAGVCSRRDAEDWIKAGRVAVNGAVIRTPAFNVTERDEISLDGQPLAARSGTRVWIYHKPAGLVVTEKDPEGRPTVFEKFAEAGLPRVLTVGRLDLNTEGLLLLTNDGGLKRVLELPSTGWLRRYRVRAFGSVTQEKLDGLKDGVEIEGVKYGPIEATLERRQGSNVWLLVALREGKNREVKNVLANLGLQVNRLIRVSYGPFQLGDLPPGGIEVVRARVLRDQLGRKLAEAAGADFDSEMPEAAAASVKAKPRGERFPPGRQGPPPKDRHRPGRPPPRHDQRRDGPPARPPRGEPRPRRIFFDDGRPPEEFVAPEPRGRREERDQHPRQGGREDRPSRGKAARPPRGSHSAPADADRPPRATSRPAGAGRPERTPRDGEPRRKFGPPGPGGRPGARPPRPGGPSAGPSRPGGRPGARPPRPGGARPGPRGGPRPKPPGGGRPPRKPRG